MKKTVKKPKPKIGRMIKREITPNDAWRMRCHGLSLPPNATYSVPWLAEMAKTRESLVAQLNELDTKLKEAAAKEADFYLIWWINPSEVEKIWKILDDFENDLNLPSYIYEEFKNVAGSTYKLHLSIKVEFHCPNYCIDPWPKTKLAKTLKNAHGIVFHSNDFEIIQQFPGLITDHNLNVKT